MKDKLELKKESLFTLLKQSTKKVDSGSSLDKSEMEKKLKDLLPEDKKAKFYIDLIEEFSKHKTQAHNADYCYRLITTTLFKLLQERFKGQDDELGKLNEKKSLFKVANYTLYKAPGHSANKLMEAQREGMTNHCLRYTYNPHKGRRTENGTALVLKSTGYPKKPRGNIHQAKENSPLEQLSTDTNVTLEITKGLEVKIVGNESEIDKKSHIIRGSDIENLQKKVQVYFTPKTAFGESITKKDVADIRHRKLELSFKSNKPKDILDRKAKYVVVRAELPALNMTDEGEVIPNSNGNNKRSKKKITRNRQGYIVYDACFPCLVGGAADLKQLCERNLASEVSKQRVSTVFKWVIRQQIQVSIANKEGLSLVAPEAFLTGLNPAGKSEAKNLFARAVADVLCEDFKNGNNFKGLYIIGTPGMEKAIDDKKKSLKLPVMVCKESDLLAPQDHAKISGKGYNVAFCLMGHPSGAIGNHAPGGQCFNAVEENIWRKILPLYNILGLPNSRKLTDETKYIRLTPSEGKLLLARQCPNRFYSACKAGAVVLAVDTAACAAVYTVFHVTAFNSFVAQGLPNTIDTFFGADVRNEAIKQFFDVMKSHPAAAIILIVGIFATTALGIGLYYYFSRDNQSGEKASDLEKKEISLSSGHCSA